MGLGCPTPVDMSTAQLYLRLREYHGRDCGKVVRAKGLNNLLEDSVLHMTGKCNSQNLYNRVTYRTHE